MGVIWLWTGDGSTSHKILPEFPDLCVLLLLIFVTWPIYLLQKHQAKGNPGNLKSNGKPSRVFFFVLCFRKQFAEVKSVPRPPPPNLCMVNLGFCSEKFHVSSYIQQSHSDTLRMLVSDHLRKLQ